MLIFLNVKIYMKTITNVITYYSTLSQFQLYAQIKTLVKHCVKSSVTALFNIPFVKHKLAACEPKLPSATKHWTPNSSVASKHAGGNFSRHGGHTGRLFERQIAKSWPV